MSYPSCAWFFPLRPADLNPQRRVLRQRRDASCITLGNTQLQRRATLQMPLATILVEDSETIRNSLIPALREIADVEVIAVAETAAEGIAAMDTYADTWRLAVVDLFLKEGNGLEVLRAGRQRQSDQRMLVLTNYATPDIRQRSMEAGADAAFDKSTEIDMFFERCSSFSSANGALGS